MYAVIQTGGKQYKVEQGQRLKVETLDAEEGGNVEFGQVLMVGEGDNVKVGTPSVKDATVSAKVMKHGRHKKINILKFKRRKQHMKRMGHRQDFTEVEITGIKG